MDDKYQEILDFWRKDINEYNDIVDVKQMALSDIYELISGLRQFEKDNKKLIDFIEGSEFDLTPEFRKHFPNGFK